MRRVFVVVAALALCAYAQEEGAEEEKIEETAPQEESRKEKAEKYVYCESDNCYDLLGVKSSTYRSVRSDPIQPEPGDVPARAPSKTTAKKTPVKKTAKS